jgi:hypothetical protein
MVLLLNQFGHTARLRIGVVKDATERLQAHAWVEHQGIIVLGHTSDLAKYTPLPDLAKHLKIL